MVQKGSVLENEKENIRAEERVKKGRVYKGW
jgi:hypothetical protein